MTRGRTLTSVPGVRVGHGTDLELRTGVTACLFDAASPTALDVRGGASCTYDTASLDLEATFGRRWAIFLAGGSIYGLDAARGIRTRLLELGAGTPVLGGRVPIVQVSGATIYDLPPRGGAISDYLPLGYEAAESAGSGPVPEGGVGAGAGATVGKYGGRERAMPGGIGSAAERIRGVGWVGVLVVANSVGAVRDPETGRWVAGARGPSGKVAPPGRLLRPELRSTLAGSGTTLAIVATDAPLDRRELKRVAVMAQAGLARAVAPAHAAVDGDVVFSVATRSRPRRLQPEPDFRRSDVVGHVASGLVQEAIVRAVQRP
ncbi:MAG: P1 family peptidase [Thermoplasmata archaeon]|nr:P1 family peptidase [Thermoplasmata archaeon]MCI4344905.1 P1 family peptidase [Thermoplasmata archaeon]